MGKKKRVDINQAPLQSVTIGKVSEHKFGWIGILLLFGLFGGIIYFLPELNQLYLEYKNSSRPSIGTGSNTTVNNTTVDNNTVNNTVSGENVIPENDMANKALKLGTDLNVVYNNIEYNNIQYHNSKLTFTANNPSEYQVEQKDLFITLFDDNKNYVKTFAINGLLDAKQSAEYEFEINDNILYYYISTVAEEDYTYIDLPVDENNNSFLICRKNNSEIKYTFSNSKLLKIDHTDTISNNQENYYVLYRQYNSTLIKTENKQGVTGSLNHENQGVKYSFSVDYSLFNETLDSDIYFAKDSFPSKVNYLMEANLYNCK